MQAERASAQAKAQADARQLQQLRADLAGRKESAQQLKKSIDRLKTGILDLQSQRSAVKRDLQRLTKHYGPASGYGPTPVSALENTEEQTLQQLRIQLINLEVECREIRQVCGNAQGALAPDQLVNQERAARMTEFQGNAKALAEIAASLESGILEAKQKVSVEELFP